jgi:hypothetical protein
MELDFDVSYLGNTKLTSFELEAKLRIREGVVPSSPSESRITGVLI